jgi:hypothetical protein
VTFQCRNGFMNLSIQAHVRKACLSVYCFLLIECRRGFRGVLGLGDNGRGFLRSFGNHQPDHTLA